MAVAVAVAPAPRNFPGSKRLPAGVLSCCWRTYVCPSAPRYLSLPTNLPLPSTPGAGRACVSHSSSIHHPRLPLNMKPSQRGGGGSCPLLRSAGELFRTARKLLELFLWNLELPRLGSCPFPSLFFFFSSSSFLLFANKDLFCLVCKCPTMIFSPDSAAIIFVLRRLVIAICLLLAMLQEAKRQRKRQQNCDQCRNQLMARKVQSMLIPASPPPPFISLPVR